MLGVLELQPHNQPFIRIEGGDFTMEVFTDRRESSESVAPSKERRGGWGWGPEPGQKCGEMKGMGDV